MKNSMIIAALMMKDIYMIRIINLKISNSSNLKTVIRIINNRNSLRIKI